MEATHGVWLSGRQRTLFEAWDRDDPPDAFEVLRDARIAALQGRGNPFVSDYERRLAALALPRD
jgi:deoxyribonuclease-1